MIIEVVESPVAQIEIVDDVKIVDVEQVVTVLTDVGPRGYGVASGGDQYDVLRKATNANFNTEWVPLVANNGIGYNASSATFSLNNYNSIYRSLSSGLKSGGVLSINAGDNSKFDMTAGTGVIVDMWTDPENPVVYDVSWDAFTAVTLTNLATADNTYILMDTDGNIVQQTTEPTPEDHRDYIYIGRIAHTNNTSIGAIVNSPDIFSSPVSQLRDLEEAIGVINMGVRVLENGANLNLNRIGGHLYLNGGNLASNPKDPSFVPISTETALSFRMRTQNGNGSTTDTLDVGNYDNAGTVTAIGSNKYQNFRVYQVSNGNLVIQYGQVLYNTMDSATSGLPSESFVLFPNLERSTVLIGVITARSTATSLSDTAQAKFTPVSKFGEVGSGAGGGGAIWGGITGTITDQNDLISYLSTNYVPYTGATGAVDLGANALTTSLLNVADGSDSTLKFQVDNNETYTGYPRTFFKGGHSTSDLNWFMRFANAYSSSALNIPAGVQISTNQDGAFTNANTLMMYATDTNNYIFSIYEGASNGKPLFLTTQANLASPGIFLDTAANGQRVGFGTSTPSAKLHAISTTEQLRIGYDASNYYKTTVGSTGGVTFDATGSGAGFTFSDPVNINTATSTSLSLSQSSTTNSNMLFMDYSGAGGGTAASQALLRITKSDGSSRAYASFGDVAYIDGSGRYYSTVSAAYGLNIPNSGISMGGEISGATRLVMSGTVNFLDLAYSGASNSNALKIVQTNAGGIGGEAYSMIYIDNRGNNDHIYAHNNTTNPFVVKKSGNVGIGTASPSARLHTIATTEQLRVGYDTNNYFNATVSNTGVVTFNAVGSGSAFTFSDPVKIYNASYYTAVSTGVAAEIGFNLNGCTRFGFNTTAQNIIQGWSMAAGQLTLNPFGGPVVIGANVAGLASHKLQVGSSVATSTATPDVLGLGGTFSNTAGANAKLRLFDNGSAVYGLGVSSSQLDYIAPFSASHVWYINDTQYMHLSSSGALIVGTGTPNASAKMQVDSTTQGILLPRMTTTQKNAISSPAEGLVVYDTTIKKLCVYTTAWETITSV